MRTTLREKFLLWVVGLTLAAGLEVLLRGQISPASPAGLAVIVPTVALVVAFAALILRRR